MIQHFGCKQATCKCQELHTPGNNPDAACMYVPTCQVILLICTKEKAQHGTTQHEMLALADSASLRCRALIGTSLVCCFVQGWLRCSVLCCAVLCCALLCCALLAIPCLRYHCCTCSTITYSCILYNTAGLIVVLCLVSNLALVR